MPRLLYVASEKPDYKDAAYYRGAHGRLFDKVLQQARLTRDDIDVLWAGDGVPDFVARTYDCVVVGGDDAALCTLGWPCKVSNYHGSILPAHAAAPTSYEAYRSWLTSPAKIIVTWDILALHKSWDLHPQAFRDWQRAGQVARGTYVAPDPDAREWIIDQPHRLDELESSHALVFDTELSPCFMVGFANDTQVHVCNWDNRCVDATRDLLTHPLIVKVAHNLQHDLAMCDLHFGFQVERPYFDTYGGATLLNTALERSLSPGLASRFTNWPYHKWLNDVDSMHYNGLDNIVCYDAYVEIVKQLKERGLWDVALHDHDLLEALYDMQRTGFRISERERAAYELEAAEELAYLDDELMQRAEPIARARLSSFAKPHLWRIDRQCTCCGGGKVTRSHCWRCGGLPRKPEKKADYYGPLGQDVEEIVGLRMPSTVAQLREALPPCSVCQATGKVEKWLAFNPDSPDQVKDLVYRGLRISPRKNKGKVTTAADKLKPLGDRYPFVKMLCEASDLRASVDTVARLRPDPSTGRVHCVFDPWGTESGRVASSEGLLRKGTNAQNIPKKARRFVVPDDGYVLLYPDMAQVEARAVAVLSRPYDDALWRAFKEPIEWPGNERHGTIDSHTKVVQMMMKAASLQITRQQAKRLTYAAMYGVSEKQLAVELTAEAMRIGGAVVTEFEAKLMLEAFYKAFPGVRRWHDAVCRQVISNRTVKSPSGRERHWPCRVMDGENQVLREIAKQTWSYTPQEIGAWVLAEGLHDIFCNSRDLLTPMIHVHDAVLFQCKLEDKAEAIEVATKALSRECFGMWFPCDMKAGANWYEVS